MSLPDNIDGLLRIGVFGQPYHGLAYAAASDTTVLLPNGQTKVLDVTLGSGNTYLVKRPGWAAITRDAEGQARDAANGWQWPNWILFGGVVSPPPGGWVFFDTDGSAWLCQLVPGNSVKVRFTRFGRISKEPPTWSEIVVTGVTKITGTLRWQNQRPDGARNCWHLLNDEDHGNKVIEVSVSGSGGAGPQTATLSLVCPLILTDSWTEDISTIVHPPCPPPPDPAYVIGDWELWGSVNRTFDHEAIFTSDYVDGALAHISVIYEVRITASATDHSSCSAAVINNNDDYHGVFDRRETNQYLYKIKVRNGSGEPLLVSSISINRSTRYYWCNPPDSESFIESSDTVTIDDMPPWTGSYSNHITCAPESTVPKSLLAWVLPAPEGLTSVCGLGSALIRLQFVEPMSLITLEHTTVYPGYTNDFSLLPWNGLDVKPGGFMSDCPWTAPKSTSTQTGGAFSGLNMIGFHGVVASVSKATNNTVVRRRYTHPPVENAPHNYSYGPVVATEAVDLTIMSTENNFHAVSYHPVNKTIARSTIAQCCYF